MSSTTVTTAPYHFHTQSGRVRSVRPGLEQSRVAGLDPQGRIVVDDYDARGGKDTSSHPFLFGLTLCCDAYDKGAEDGIVCRHCFDTVDTGSYLFAARDGSFPELDPVVLFCHGGACWAAGDRPAQVTIDGDLIFPCTVPVPEVRWNGFSCPTFDRETAERVIAMVTAGSDVDDYYRFLWTTDRDGVQCLVVGCSDGNDSWEWEPCGDTVNGFPIGSWSWTWYEEQDI